MLALEVEGITTYTPIGDNPNQLTWQNTHHGGAKLLLTVVDSIGQTGGFPTSFFNSVAASPGSDTTCLIPEPTPSTPRIVSSITGNLNTCEPWKLSITGGTKPYNVTLAQLGAGNITVAPMGPYDDVFVYIDRAGPGFPLIAGVTDSTGQWGVSTIAINTTGSSDTDCVGLVSVSETEAQFEAQEAVDVSAARASSAKAHARSVALGIVFGLVLPLLAGGLVGLWWWRRRRSLQERRLGQVQTQLPAYDEEQPQERQVRPNLNLDMSQVANVVRVDSQQYRTASWAVDSELSIRQTDSPSSMDMSTTELHQTIPTPYMTSATLPRPITTAKSPLSPPDPLAMTPNSTSPAATLTPEARYRKALEAHAEAQANRARLQAQLGTNPGQSPIAGPSSRRPHVQRSQSAGVVRTFPAQPLPRRMGASLRLPPVAAISEEGPDIIIQHRDGGIVEELPPPYFDTGRYSEGREDATETEAATGTVRGS
ncbi:hypothetical protein GY45DRAFT_1312648 [Cubamyces sp. BRFM 1775]|nr:hypothetical protein GY45DRAFT_1312648 [Cubamyces sp. BRFM 1775]